MAWRTAVMAGRRIIRVRGEAVNRVVYSLLPVVGLLAGCVTPPALGPAPEPKSASAYAASLSFAAPDAHWPKQAWWNSYGDSQLTALIEEGLAARSEERRVGQEGVSTGRSRGSPYHEKKKSTMTKQT